MRKIDNDMYNILSWLTYKPLTTKELEDITTKENKIPRATFYNIFRKAKKEGFLTSKTNDQHQIVWEINQKGKDYYYEVLQHFANLGKDYMFSFIDRLQDKFSGCTDIWMENKEFQKKFTKEDQTLIKMATTLGFKIFAKYPNLFEIDRIKINKKELDKLVKEKKKLFM